MPLDLSVIGAGIAPSATLAMDTKAKEFIAAGFDVIKFGVGEPDFDTPEFIRTAAKEAIDAGKTRYTPVAGTTELRWEIAQKFARDNNLDYDASGEIIVSSGAKQVLYEALCVLLNPGDEVILPAPFWVSYYELIRMAGGVPVVVTATEAEDFKLSAEKLAAAITPLAPLAERRALER